MTTSKSAEVIRAEQPWARIYALALAHKVPYAESFLARVNELGKLALIDAITVHTYPNNPDDTRNIDQLRAIIAKHDQPIAVRQGETGATSKYQENFALRKLPMTETIQAKWNLRRMLAHHGKDVPFNLFTMIDLHYLAKTVLRGLLLAAGLAANAAEPVRIYLANDDHTDFMWTADADTYANVFVEMLDFHLNLADETATNAPPYRNRFNADGNYWLWNYEQKKSPAEFARLVARLKDGTISAPLNALVSCYGGQPIEAVLRGMYYAGRLERRHGVRLRLAVAMENQTLPLGLASLFAGSGARYSWRGVCGCASRFDNRVLGERPHEIYWWTGHDDQRLLLKWHSLAPAGNQHSGGYAEAFDPVAAVHFLDSDPGFLSRYRARGASDPYRVRAAFGFGWDALDRKTGRPYLADPEKYPLTGHFHRIAQRLSTPERQVIVSNEQDFFEDFETTHGASLDSMAVTHGNEWDLYSASMSETSARAKRAVEKLRSAEMLAALVSLKYPPFMTNHRAARDRAFLALGLYWEHNWTADGPISRARRAAWQEQLVGEIESFVNAVYDEAVRRLGGMIPRPTEANRFFVLNPLGWARTDAADLPYPGPADIHVRDLTKVAESS